jgi:hypothetical protein
LSLDETGRSRESGFQHGCSFAGPKLEGIKSPDRLTVPGLGVRQIEGRAASQAYPWSSLARGSALRSLRVRNTSRLCKPSCRRFKTQKVRILRPDLEPAKTRQTQFNKSIPFRGARGLAKPTRNQSERRCLVYNERHAGFALRLQSRRGFQDLRKTRNSEQFVFVLMLALHGWSGSQD